MLIPISVLRGGAVADGDFGARFRDGVLFLPARLSRLLKKWQIETAQDFVTYLQTFPLAFERQLKWRPPQVAAATRQLVTLLAEAMPEDHTWREEAPRARSYGARLISQP